MDGLILSCWLYLGVGYMLPPEYNYSSSEIERQAETVGRAGAKCALKHNFEVSLEHQSLLDNGFITSYVDNSATLAIDYKIYFYRR